MSNLKLLIKRQTEQLWSMHTVLGRYGSSVTLLYLYYNIIIVTWGNCSWICWQVGHEESCDFMIILCPSCKELMRANEQEHHNERECPERTLYCKYCKDPFHLKNIKVKCQCTAAHCSDWQHFICDGSVMSPVHLN